MEISIFPFWMYCLGRIQFLGKLGGPGLPLRVIIGQERFRKLCLARESNCGRKRNG